MLTLLGNPNPHTSSLSAVPGTVLPGLVFFMVYPNEFLPIPSLYTQSHSQIPPTRYYQQAASLRTTDSLVTSQAVKVTKKGRKRWLAFCLLDLRIYRHSYSC